MNNRKILKILYKIKKRPSMYLFTDNTIEVISLITGMDIVQEKPLGHLFGEWLKTNKLEGISSPFYWSKLIQNYFDTCEIKDENKIDIIIDFWIEFLLDLSNSDKETDKDLP